MEDKIQYLNKNHSILTKKLQKQDEQMLIILLSLQKIAIRPRDTMILQPFKPNDAIRSGLLLSSLLPGIKERTINMLILAKYNAAMEAKDEAANIIQ